MSARRRSSPRRVALLIEASRAYARGLVRGVALYQREHQPWAVTYTPRGLDDPPPAWLRDWEGDGILARINDRRMAEALARKGVPVIDLRRALRDLPCPSLGPDDAAVARRAFEHLLERGFRRFAFLGLPRGSHMAMDTRAEEFGRLAKEAGLECRFFHLGRDWATARQRGESRRLATWLAALPKPVGAMACNDDLGLLVLEACRRAGLLVPDQVAVVGAGNDDCLCDLGVPPLSSVDLNSQRIGYEAAAMLDSLMSGIATPRRHVVLPPGNVVARTSTDVLATADEGVIRAVRYIRQHACGPIHTKEVLHEARMSRARLEPRLKQILGRTVHQEIQRVRLARVQELLETTSAPLKQIAMQAGFRYPEYMMRVFRQATGQTLGQYRKSVVGKRPP